MRMQIENVYVLTAHVGTQNVETKYVKLDLIDADDPWGESCTMTIFESTDKAMVKYLTSIYADAQADGTDQFGQVKYAPSILKDATKALPDNRKVIPGIVRAEAPTPGGEPYIRTTEVNGVRVPAKNAVPINSLMLWCRKVKDNETGEMSWKSGWSPAERMTSIIAHLYKPCRETGLPETGEIVSAPVQAPVTPQMPQQPAPQQQAPQAQPQQAQPQQPQQAPQQPTATF